MSIQHLDLPIAVQDRVQEICTLHEQVRGYYEKTLEGAIRIGQLLTEQKEALPHGDFTAWAEANFPFTARTARKYMNVYLHQDRLKRQTLPF